MNSRAIERIFKNIRGNLSIFNPSYLLCKGLTIKGNIIMKKILIVASLTLIPTLSIAASSTNSKIGATAKIGTLGAGLDLSYRMNQKLNARLNFNGGSKSFDGTESGVTYKGSLKLSTVGVLLDYYPFGGGFRVSAGLYNNGNKLNSTSTNATNADIGGVAYDITGTLDSKVKFKSTAPYLGIGWGNPVKGVKNLRFNIDAGVLAQGAPNAKLTGTGTATPAGGGAAVNISTDAAFLNNLAQEEKDLNDALSNFKAYPAISLGISYGF